MPHVCPQGLEEGVGYPGHGATGVCERPDVGAGAKLKISGVFLSAELSL